jgi:hypothetical protein
MGNSLGALSDHWGKSEEPNGQKEGESGSHRHKMNEKRSQSEWELPRIPPPSPTDHRYNQKIRFLVQLKVSSEFVDEWDGSRTDSENSSCSAGDLRAACIHHHMMCNISCLTCILYSIPANQMNVSKTKIIPQNFKIHVHILF